MGQLELMKIFVNVVEAGTITKAAEQLGISKSVISKRLMELDEQLGVKLINRSTRKSRLTDLGSEFYQQSRSILDQVRELDSRMKSRNESLTGTLRISLPLSFGMAYLSPLLDRFICQHPKLKLDVDFSDSRVDLIEEGFDLAFRIGDLEDSSLQARRLLTIKHILCASPAYLKINGIPKTLADLENHKFLEYTHRRSYNNLIKNSGLFKFEKFIFSNNGEYLRMLATKGHGFVCLPDFLVKNELSQRELIQISLDDFELPEIHGYVVFPQNRFLPTKARKFIDFIVDNIENAL